MTFLTLPHSRPGVRSFFFKGMPFFCQPPRQYVDFFFRGYCLRSFVRFSIHKYLYIYFSYRGGISLFHRIFPSGVIACSIFYVHKYLYIYSSYIGYPCTCLSAQQIWYCEARVLDSDLKIDTKSSKSEQLCDIV